MPNRSIVVKDQFRVERHDLPLVGNDKGIDLAQRAIFGFEEMRQTHQGIDELLHSLLGCRAVGF
jgi:hypothetical protein